MENYNMDEIFTNIFIYITFYMVKPVFVYDEFEEKLDYLIKNPIEVDNNTKKRAKDAVEILSKLSKKELKEKFIVNSEILSKKRYVEFKKDILRVAWLR